MTQAKQTKIAVTGKPGIGKSTLCLKVLKALKESNIDCCGFITKEVREKGARVGFKVIDISGNRDEFWLAISQKSDKLNEYIKNNKKEKLRISKVGKYLVLLDNFEDYIFKLRNIDKCKVVIIDEVGPMELKSKEFVKFIEELMNKKALCLFTIHLTSKHPILKEIRKNFEIYTLNFNNREAIAKKIIEKLLSRMK